MKAARTEKPRLSLLLGALFIVAGVFAAAVCLYSALTTMWPLGVMYLFGLFGGVWTFVTGLGRVRQSLKRDRP